ncbi:unnamed protein product [Phytophthora lilii]|uniref:Unnamed protein product n=1 Tax=Phytophthora lilii TaxID=2077276 RepID=A0A9W6X9S6_9STRA|nr:unnamed protein product [Phytophthora lilii]
MASFLKLDSTNLVQDGTNSTWKYSFPGSAADFRDVVCAIQSITMYNSEYNIDSFQFQNTTFKVEVPTAATTSTISISLQDGIYSYDDINRSIQTALVNAGAYLINPSGENVFYLKKGIRPDRGYLPSASATAASAQLSNIIPQIHSTCSYIVRCDLIKNEYVASGDTVSAFDRGDAEIGKLISYKPSQYAWMNCHNGSRLMITVSIFNQNDKTVIFRDTSVSIMLLLRPKK